MENNYTTFTDSRDGKVYKTIRIGNQVIMAENLQFETNGGCWAYENNEAFVKEYGYLYNWEAAKKASDDLPGWHLPTKEEWKSFLDTVQSEYSDYFEAILTDGESGFNAALVGILDTDGSFFGFGDGANFWSATEKDEDHSWGIGLLQLFSNCSLDYYEKNRGFSIRLFKDLNE